MQKLYHALDVGSSELRLIAATHRAGKLKLLSSEEEFYDGFMDGEFLSPDDFINALSKIVNATTTKFNSKISSVTVGVPIEFCVCVCKRISRKFVSQRKIRQTDINALIESNANFGDSEEYAVINYSPMQYVLDDDAKTMQPVGKKSSQLVMDISYILAKKSFINFMLDQFASLGINNVDFVSASLGQAIMCAKDNEETKPIAVVDVGHISTSVSVLKGEGLALLSSFSMGGGHISSDIMQVLGLSFKEAEIVKRKVILTIDSFKNSSYEVCSGASMVKAPINMTNQIVKSRIETIAKVVADILSVDEVFKGVNLYLTGDGITNFKGAKQIFKDVLNLNVLEFKNQYDGSTRKYQTSSSGLLELMDMVK